MKAENPEIWFHNMATHYVEAQVLFHLNQAGVFREILASKSLTVEQLATRLNLQPEPLASLLEYIHGVDKILNRSESGAYSFSEFGKAVCKRFGRTVNDSVKLNFFDVRVGAYGLIWSSLEKILAGDRETALESARQGELAAEALHATAPRFYPALAEAIRICSARSVVEIGASTVPLELLKADFSDVVFTAFDRNEKTLEKAKRLAESSGFSAFHVEQGDFFSSSWKKFGGASSLFYSVHFHELLASGSEKIEQALRAAKLSGSGSHLLVLEQPKPTPNASIALHELQYAHSNVLIHHLVGKGRILSTAEWIFLLEKSGLQLKKHWRTEYLGYEAFLFSF